MLVVFDLDGTLIDSRAFIIEAARRTFADGSPPYPGDEAFLATIGLLPERMMDRLFPEHPETDRRSFAARYIERVWELRREQPEFEAPYAGTEALLAAVADAGHTLGIATGKKRAGVDHMLDRTGWGERFRFATIQAAESGPSKPDPTLLRNAMSETGHAAAASVMIGDTVHDMAMARSAGIMSVGVSWGYGTADELRPAGADHVVDSVPDLQRLLARLS